MARINLLVSSSTAQLVLTTTTDNLQLLVDPVKDITQSPNTLHNTYKNNKQPPQPLSLFRGPTTPLSSFPSNVWPWALPLLVSLGISQTMDIRSPWLIAHMSIKRRISLWLLLLTSWQPWWPLERVMGDVQWLWWCVVQISAPLANETLLCARRSDNLFSRPTPRAPPAKRTEQPSCWWWRRCLSWPWASGKTGCWRDRNMLNQTNSLSPT